MDSYREHPSDFEPDFEVSEADAPARPPEIGTDERRMHVRAYNYWASRLDGRDYPSIEDLEPDDLVDFAPHSLLLDFTAGRDNPALPYIGAAIREECDLPEDVRSIEQVPHRSLLSRLTDHYMQIIANRAPVGFEAEFENQRGEELCYRGILMPFSSDGDTIDFIYGVINWKKADAPNEPAVPVHPMCDPQPEAIDSAVEESVANDCQPVPFAETEPEELVLEDAALEPVSFDEPEPEEPAIEDSELVLGAADVLGTDSDYAAAGAVPFAPEIATAADEELLVDIELDAAIELGADAALADRLWAAREVAETAKEADGRSRSALYRALSHAYDFALAAKADPDDYAELLEDSGVKAQARAPMTPVVKLVFGIDHDKARLTEYAAALSYAEREQVELGGFLAFIEVQAGGLKALVAAERLARRPASKDDTKTERARRELREVTPITLADVDSEEEFALVLTRRSSDGSHQPVAIVDDPALVERAIRKAANC